MCHCTVIISTTQLYYKFLQIIKIQNTLLFLSFLPSPKSKNLHLFHIKVNMASKQTLRDQLTAKSTQINVIVEQISNILQSVHKLSQKFLSESNKLQHRINKVQFSRPRGNPSNQWPHCPMTSRIHVFYQIKDRKERDLRNSKDLKQQIFDHEKAILTSRRSILEEEKHVLESQVKLINIQLHNYVNYDFWHIIITFDSQ